MEQTFNTYSLSVDRLAQNLLRRVTWEHLGRMVRDGEALTALVVSDGEGAALAERSQVEIVVAGFSDGGPLGTPSEVSATLPQTTELIETIRARNAYSLIVGDIPRKMYDRPYDFIRVAELLMQVGADAVKIEGGREIAPLVQDMTDAGIIVVGHIGYTPKTGMKMRKRGATREDVLSLEFDAHALIEAGVSALVLEMVLPESATYLTQVLSVPTVGIYSGGGTSGQALVLNDLLDRTNFGGFPKGKPLGVGRWLGEAEERVRSFRGAVKARSFPLLHCLASDSVDQQWVPSGGHFQ